MNEDKIQTLKITGSMTLKMLSSTFVADNTKHNPKVIHAGTKKRVRKKERLEATTYSPDYRHRDLYRPGRDTGHIPAKRGKKRFRYNTPHAKSVHIAPRTYKIMTSILQSHSRTHIPSTRYEFLAVSTCDHHPHI